MAASRAAIASYHLKHPCKLWLTREESMQEGTKRHPLWANYSVGFDGGGRLLAAKIDLLLDGGAYTSKSYPVTSRMAIEATGPYYMPVVDTTATCVYTNHVYSDALHGFGSPQVDFCSESLLDEIAEVGQGAQGMMTAMLHEALGLPRRRFAWQRWTPAPRCGSRF